MEKSELLDALNHLWNQHIGGKHRTPSQDEINDFLDAMKEFMEEF